MQVVKVGSGILTGDLGEHDTATGVGVDKVRQIIYAVVDNAPEGVLGVVLGDLSAGEDLGGHS